MTRTKFVGKVFSEVTVQAGPYKRPTKNGKLNWYYECLCSCGSTCYISAANISGYSCGLRSGTMSCGCFRTRDLDTKLFKDSWSTIKRNASSRGLDLTLTFPEFVKLVKAPCVYCGFEGRDYFAYRNRLNRLAKRDGYELNPKYKALADVKKNGIDRVDNSVGYTTQNSVSCCDYCNKAKGAMPIENFQGWLARIKKYNPA